MLGEKNVLVLGEPQCGDARAYCVDDYFSGTIIDLNNPSPATEDDDSGWSAYLEILAEFISDVVIDDIADELADIVGELKTKKFSRKYDALWGEFMKTILVVEQIDNTL